MRMWMIDPSVLCRKHLLGEHGEIHKFRHNFVKGHSIRGRRGQIEPLAMQARHDDLAAEMLRRGYKHQSPYEQPDLSHYAPEDREMRVCLETSMRDLQERCPECLARITEALRVL